MSRLEDAENRKKISRILIGTGVIALTAVGFLLYFWSSISVDIPKSDGLSFRVVAEGRGGVGGEAAQILVFPELDTVCIRIVSGTTGSSQSMHCWPLKDAPSKISETLSTWSKAENGKR